MLQNTVTQLCSCCLAVLCNYTSNIPCCWNPTGPWPVPVDWECVTCCDAKVE